MQAMQLATVAAVMPLNQRRMNLPMQCERQLGSCRRQHMASMRLLMSSDMQKQSLGSNWSAASHIDLDQEEVVRYFLMQLILEIND